MKHQKIGNPNLTASITLELSYTLSIIGYASYVLEMSTAYISCSRYKFSKSSYSISLAIVQINKDRTKIETEFYYLMSMNFIFYLAFFV